MASRSFGLRKYSPDASCKSSYEESERPEQQDQVSWLSSQFTFTQTYLAGLLRRWERGVDFFLLLRRRLLRLVLLRSYTNRNGVGVLGWPQFLVLLCRLFRSLQVALLEFCGELRGTGVSALQFRTGALEEHALRLTRQE